MAEQANNDALDLQAARTLIGELQAENTNLKFVAHKTNLLMQKLLEENAELKKNQKPAPVKQTRKKS